MQRFSRYYLTVLFTLFLACEKPLLSRCYEFVILDTDPQQESYLVGNKHYTYDQFYDKWPKGLDQCNGCESGYSMNENGDCVIYSASEPVASCGTQEIISDYIWELAISGSDGRKIFIEHTQSLRTMARTGSISALRNQLCNYTTSSVNTLKTGHQSDVNNVGFAPQLMVEHYIISMYHPNNYPDHFIIYDTLTGEWTRWEENGTNPRIYLSSN